MFFLLFLGLVLPFLILFICMDLVGTSTEVERARKPTIQRQAV